MRWLLTCVLVCAACTATATYAPVATLPPAPDGVADAPTAFDGLPNGMVDLATHRGDQAVFDRQEEVSSGLGPLYNAHSCRDCHENPVPEARAR